MTGIERYFKEERAARMLLFKQKLQRLRDEFADLDLFLMEPVEPDTVVEVRMPTRRWSWK